MTFCATFDESKISNIFLFKSLLCTLARDLKNTTAISTLCHEDEEAKEDMRNGRYSSVEDAISKIRKTHGL